MSWGNTPGWRPSAAPRGGLSGAIWKTLVRLWVTLGDSGRLWAPRLSLAEVGFLEPLCTEAKGCQRKPGSRVSQSLPESTRVYQSLPENHQNPPESPRDPPECRRSVFARDSGGFRVPLSRATPSTPKTCQNGLLPGKRHLETVPKQSKMQQMH